MNVKKTISSIFIVPILLIDKVKLSDNGFVNGYMHDIHKDIQYEDCVYLLFKPTDLEKFREFLEKLYEDRPEDIVDDYDYEGGHVVIVHRINNKYKSDIDLVMQGKYSQTSEMYQRSFPKVVKIMVEGFRKDEVSLQHRIFKKTDDLKLYWEDVTNETFTDDMEVWPTFDLFKETLDIDKHLKQE